MQVRSSPDRAKLHLLGRLGCVQDGGPSAGPTNQLSTSVRLTDEIGWNWMDGDDSR